MVDNGNHLILSANENFLELCKLLKSENTLVRYNSKFNFFDYKEKKKWSLELPKTAMPLWIFNKKKRIPNTKVKDYFEILKFILMNKNHTVQDLFSKNNNLYKKLWEPLTLGILNTECKNASAYLLWNVLKKTFLRGGKYCQIYQPIVNWSDSLINPALDFLKENKSKINYNNLLKKIEVEENRVKKLIFQKNELTINDTEKVIIAIPPSNIMRFLPELKLPKDYNTIINIHFKYKYFTKIKETPIFGLINSKSHWVFTKNNYISVTISAANDLNSLDSELLIKSVWDEVTECLGIKDEILPEYKILKEKKATYNQSPKNNNLIKNIKNLPTNLFLAGDWTESSFPSTIESSILSGKNALNRCYNF